MEPIAPAPPALRWRNAWGGKHFGLHKDAYVSILMLLKPSSIPHDSIYKTEELSACGAQVNFKARVAETVVWKRIFGKKISDFSL
jgi:hypothetical protein